MSDNRAEKAKVIERLYEMFGTHKQIILANFTNVGSSQIQQIRKVVRGYNSHLIINKNTLTKKVLRMRTEGIEEDEFKYLEEQYGGKIPELAAIIPILKDKIALIMSDAPIFELKQKIEANKLATEARVGVVSPIDFVVPAGSTGLDPSQINFFHALNISTKINKGQIEMTKDFKVCTKDKKVKASEAALLKKLNIKPFHYGMHIFGAYDNGSILSEEVINIDPASLLTKFQTGIKNLAGLSLSAGYPIEATVPLILASSFRNIAALSLESGYSCTITLDFRFPKCLPVPAPPSSSKKSKKNPKSNNRNPLRNPSNKKKKRTWIWAVSLIDEPI